MATALFKQTQSYGIMPLMSRKGNPYDNAMAENFFSIPKAECIYRHKPETFREMNNLIDRYIHFYNYEQQSKTGVAPLTPRHSASNFLFPTYGLLHCSNILGKFNHRKGDFAL